VVNRFRRVAALGMVACAMGCTTPRMTPDSDSQRDWEWQRSVDCAERGDLLGTEQRRDDRPDGFNLTSVRTHYSRKTGRCYVLMHYSNAMRGAQMTSRTEVVDGLERYQYAEFAEPISEPTFQDSQCRKMTTDGKRELSTPGCQSVAEYVNVLMRE
jgi:hypothetical protein